MRYRQTKGERYCLVYSFASALAYLGINQLASEILQAANIIVEKHNTFALFTTYLLKKSKYLNFKKLKRIKWNILENEEKDLVIVALKSTNGKEDHCVTLVGKWIFDSNFLNALPLCQDALDLCCSSDTVPDTFHSVVEARLFPSYSFIRPVKK